MAKKFGKILLATAAIGTAVAAAYYYMQKKEGVSIIPEDEDFEDLDDDLDDDCEPCRNYVPLTPDPAVSETQTEEDSNFTPLSEQVENVAETAEEAIEDVEEFFDEEDTAN